MTGGWRHALIGLCLAVLLSACATPRVQHPGPASMEPVLNGDHFLAADGARLPVRRWLPERDRPAAVVIAVHGFNDYGNFFADAAAYLARRDIATYAFDQRGFGAAPRPGIWAGVDGLASDLRTALALIRQRYPSTPLFLLGESMGGAVVMVAQQRAAAAGTPLDIDGAILSAPAVWGRLTMPWYQRLALWVSAHTVPSMTLTGRGLKIMASDNIEMLRALGRDPLIIKKTRVDALYGLTNLMDAALDAAPDLDLPLLILYGEKDEVIPKKPTEIMLSRLPPGSRELRRVIFYDNGYHMLMRDLQAETVWNDIAAWIEAPRQSARRE